MVSTSCFNPFLGSCSRYGWAIYQAELHLVKVLYLSSTDTNFQKVYLPWASSFESISSQEQADRVDSAAIISMSLSLSRWNPQTIYMALSLLLLKWSSNLGCKTPQGTEKMMAGPQREKKAHWDPMLGSHGDSHGRTSLWHEKPWDSAAASSVWSPYRLGEV